jgi:hypothetical protein
MTAHPPEDISERSFRFVCDVYDYCEDLVKLRGLPCRLAYTARRRYLLQESNELVAIYVTIVRKLKRK